MKNARILVVTNIASDADLVRKLLLAEFENVFVSTEANLAVEDFERRKPDVLILAFNTLGKAKHYYLNLYRSSKLVHTLPHRTLILCRKDEEHLVYELCRQERFDDYALFWPLHHDEPRLLMAVFQALRDLEHTRGTAPLAKMVRQARRIAELEEQLERQICIGQLLAQKASHFMEQAEGEIDAAIGSFSTNLAQGRLGDALGIPNPARVQQGLDQLKAESVGEGFAALNDAVKNIGQWVGEMKQQLAPHLEPVRALKLLADAFRPVVLVVDDDDYERKLFAKIMENEPYDLMFADSGAEALGILSKKRPDLILMDLVMPEINGLEVLRRLKAASEFADIPVMMITGQSEKNVVVESLKAGAVDFVVKPLVREIFLEKVARFLAG